MRLRGTKRMTLAADMTSSFGIEALPTQATSDNDYIEARLRLAANRRAHRSAATPWQQRKHERAD